MLNYQSIVDNLTNEIEEMLGRLSDPNLEQSRAVTLANEITQMFEQLIQLRRMQKNQ